MQPSPREVGRYVLLDKIAAGGMATVYLGRLRDERGGSYRVAIKAMHAHLASDEEFRRMFLDEARIVSSIRHPNVAALLDVIEDRDELFLVMEYVEGVPLSQLLRVLSAAHKPIPLPVVNAIVADVLEGLHAAHDARSENGAALEIVHRDVSPQNIIVGTDGMARILDFGVAHAADRLQRTASGHVKGKAAYMSPEQAQGKPTDRRSDVYAASIVLWESLTGERLFDGETVAASIVRQLHERPSAPSTLRADVPPALDAIALKGLSKRAADRFATAREMVDALDRSSPRALHREVAEWLAAEASVHLAPSEKRPTTHQAGDLGPMVVEPTDKEDVRDPRRGRRAAAVVGVALLGAAASVAIARVARPHASPEKPSSVERATVAPALVTPALVTPPDEDASASSSGSATQTVSVEPAPHGVAPSASRSPSPRHRGALQPGAIDRPMAPPTSSPGAPKYCCAGHLVVNFDRDCVDNCPN